MAKDLLNAAQVRPTLQQVRGSGVTQPVRANIRRALDDGQPLVHDPPNGPLINAASAGTEEERCPARF